MVQKIDRKFIEDVCRAMKFYDSHGRLPSDRVRINVTISAEAFEKTKNTNRSRLIDELILKK